MPPKSDIALKSPSPTIISDTHSFYLTSFLTEVFFRYAPFLRHALCITNSPFFALTPYYKVYANVNDTRLLKQSLDIDMHRLFRCALVTFLRINVQ